MNRILGIIPARGGSKGIPRKNLVELHGQPLLAYTVRAAQSSRRLGRLILSTEDPEIIEVGRRLGVDVPFVRPAELAGDTVGSVAVVRHALDEVERQESARYDAVVLLEPTSPLRTADDIDEAIARLEATGADSVVSVCRVDAPHPIKMQVIQDGYLRPFLPQHWREGLARQQLLPVYALNGAVYAVRAGLVREHDTLWGERTIPLVMPSERSVNIDSLLDLTLAEILLRSQV